MHDQLRPVWDKVQKYLEEGLSIIPIRDKPEGDKKAKSPYTKWTEAQKKPYLEDELWSLMEPEHYNTTAIGIVCGKVSGNLEAIDIDVKYNHGIDAKLFSAIKQFYPDLLSRVRITKTPSGGFHILYRCETPVPGNQKLAGRPATESELETDPKNKKYYFLETRGEGGYVAGPPSLGYKIAQDNPLPILTTIERESLIQLCRSFNEIYEVVKEYTPTKTDNSIYEENPFVDFNQKADGPQLAIDLGWNLLKHNSEYFWFSRPGSTKTNVHMSWMVGRRMFKIFTTKTELEGEKSYSPANFISILKFAGDKKQTYSFLVNSGYGKVKPKVEAAMIKKAATNNTDVQANFSEKAKSELEKQKQLLKERHPHGIFWEADEDGKIVISRERLYSVVDGLGYRLHDGDIVQVVNKFIHERDQIEFYHGIRSYILESDAELYEDIFNSTDSFLQNNGKHIIAMLPIIEKNQYLTDTRQICNKFFLNGYLTITKNGYLFNTYDNLNSLVFYSRVQMRDFVAYKGGLYTQYLDFAVGISDYLRRIVGFLSHEYKDNSLAYIVVLVEQVPDPKDGGGSGKNLFGHLLKGTTSVTGKAASQTKKMDETIFQIWKGEKLFTINDLPPDFDLVFFKDISSDGFVLKKLYKNEIYVKSEDGFKPLLSTNFSYNVSDGGLARRIIPVEFTPFFTQHGGVKKYFEDKLFPNDWSSDDWAGFDTFIAESIVEWFKCGMELQPQTLSTSGWQKQFIQNFSQTAFDFISKFWLSWLEAGFITNDEFRKQLEDYYLENSTTNDRFKLSPQKLNAAITEWGKKNGFLYEKEHVKKVEHNIAKKGKIFLEVNKLPF